MGRDAETGRREQMRLSPGVGCRLAGEGARARSVGCHQLPGGGAGELGTTTGFNPLHTEPWIC